MGLGDNVLKLNVTTVAAPPAGDTGNGSKNSISLGLIPAGKVVTKTYELVFTNLLAGTEGPVKLIKWDDPSWCDVKVTYTELSAATVPPVPPPSDGAGLTALVTGPPGTLPMPLPDSSLVSGAYGQSYALLSTAGVPWPANAILAVNPAQPPLPTPFLPGDGTPGVGVPAPGFRGMSQVALDMPVKFVRQVNTLPYPRSAAAQVTGSNIAAVLDLDTWTGRSYKLSVQITTKSNIQYSRTSPQNNVKSFALTIAFPSVDVKTTFAVAFVAPDAKKVTESSVDSLPAYVLENVSG